MTLIAPLITGFMRDYMVAQRCYSPHTCETYAHCFRLLLAFASNRIGTRPSQLHVEQLSATLIEDFLLHIERERRNGAVTRNVRLAAIKAFMRYVEYRVPSLLQQVGQIRAIPTKRHEHKLIQHLNMEEIRAILNAPDIRRVSESVIGRCCISASRQACVSRSWSAPFLRTYLYDDHPAFWFAAKDVRSARFRSGRRRPPICVHGLRYGAMFVPPSYSSTLKARP
jgi:integrase